MDVHPLNKIQEYRMGIELQAKRNFQNKLVTVNHEYKCALIRK